MATYYESGEPMQLRQIATLQNIPDRYLEQVVATLRRGGIVKSQAVVLRVAIYWREPRKISVFEILTCLEGLDIPVTNSTYEAEVNLKTRDGFAIAEIWHQATQAANSILQKYSLQDLCEKRDARRQINIMYCI